MSLRYNFNPKTGNLDGVTASTKTAITNPIDVNDGQRQKVFALSALVTVDCETENLTLAGLWQGSNDGSTWVDIAYAPQNPAAVVFATGTAGADASVTKCFPAPDAVYGWRKARFAVLTAGATGATTDTYAGSFNFRSVR